MRPYDSADSHLLLSSHTNFGPLCDPGAYANPNHYAPGGYSDTSAVTFYVTGCILTTPVSIPISIDPGITKLVTGDKVVVSGVGNQMAGGR